MALLDLKTNLKSLKYGNDTPGGGSSGQPYQQVDINKVDSGFNKFRLTKFDDGLVRGGVVGAANASIVDTFRIGKFLKDFPKGPLFIVKQVGLQLSNPQLEHKTDFPTNRPTREQGLLKNVGNFISNTANKILNTVGPTRIYNLGINTLAQVPINAFGQHIVRHGFIPKRDNDNLYFKVAQYNNNEANNKLTQLRSILGNTKDIANYIGGPSSVYGIGNTLIRRRGDFIIVDQDITANGFALTGSLEKSKSKQLVSFNAASNKLRNRAFLGVSTNFMSALAENKFEEDGEAILRKDENQPKSLNDQNWSNYSPSIKSFPSASSSGPDLESLIKELGLKEFKIKSPTIISERQISGFENGVGPDRQLENATVKGNVKPPKISIGNTIPSLSTAKEPIRRSTITSYNNNKEAFKFRSKGTTDNLTRLNKDENLDSKLIANATQVSRIDSRLQPYIDDTSNIENSSIRDNTAIKYNSSIPSQRKYSELINAINKISSGKSNTSIYGLINSDNLQQQNKENNFLSSDGITTYRDISSTGFSTKPQEEITYFNGIQTNGNYEKVVIKTKGSWNKISREQRVGSGRQDQINLTPIFEAATGTIKDQIFIPGVGEKNINDLVKFRIQALNYNNPSLGKWMIFRAYITQFSDNVDASWNPVKYAGRGDKFYIYDGFERKVSISFKVAALSAEEMKPMYQKLNYLMGNLMGSYEDGLLHGPMVKMTIGNWFDGQDAFINSLTYTVPSDSPWEIAISDVNGVEPLILPHVLEVNMTFTPIGSQTKGVNKLSEKFTEVSNIAQNVNDAQYTVNLTDIPKVK
jgi:hypothetical protein